MTEDHRFAEFFIHLVGPPLHLADSVLERALDIHFKSKNWHFYKKDVKTWLEDSIVISKLKKIKAKFPFTAMVLVDCLVLIFFFLLEKSFYCLLKIRDFPKLSSFAYFFWISKSRISIFYSTFYDRLNVEA